MHILIGALIGAACGAIGAVVVALVLHRRVTFRTVCAGALAGLVSGAITALTLGAGGIAAASVARAASAYVAGGASGGAAGKIYDNLWEGQPVTNQLVRSTAIGAGTGLISFGTAKVAEPLVRRVAPSLAEGWFGERVDAPTVAPRAPPTPETPGLTKALEEISSDAH